MTESGGDADDARWEALGRTAAAVRADESPLERPRSWRGTAVGAATTAALAGLVVAALHAVGGAVPAHADGTADSALFSLTNQDRTSNGVRSMSYDGTLSVIGEGGRYNGCGFPVNGRSVDMIQRNYFAHPILNCGQLVFSIMQAYGVHYLSAGENIGWNTYGDAGTAASQINIAFMNSPDHRANILNGNYTALGIGSDNSGSTPWSGGGGSYTGAWMFSEEFAQLSSRPPPPPPPPPPPRKPRPTGTTPTRNTTPPPAPRQAPAVAPLASPAPSSAPPASSLPSLLPVPGSLPSLTLPPLLDEPGGLLFNSVESVLESYLID